MLPDTPLLAFDTSAAHCAAALLSGDGTTLVAHHESMARGQAERLMVLLEEVLDEAGCVWGDLGAFAVGVGPGNFTGIRISVAAARGLALGLGVPAVGVSGLEALAEGAGGPVRALVAAPRGQVYAQDFGRGTCKPTLMDRVEAGETDLPLIEAREDFAAALGRVALARLAAGTPLPRPAPLYLRPADAAPPRDSPPVILP